MCDIVERAQALHGKAGRRLGENQRPTGATYVTRTFENRVGASFGLSMILPPMKHAPSFLREGSLVTQSPSLVLFALSTPGTVVSTRGVICDSKLVFEEWFETGFQGSRVYDL